MSSPSSVLSKPVLPLKRRDAARFCAVLLAVGLVSVWAKGLLPILLAAATGILLPIRSRCVRGVVTVSGALLALLALHLWPGSTLFAPLVGTEEPTTLLSWLLGLPITSSLVVLCLPAQAEKAIKTWTLATLLLVFATSLPLLCIPMEQGFHGNQDLPWIDALGIRYHVAVDGISLWLVLLTTGILPLATYVSFGSIQTRLKTWCFSLLLLEGALLGVFVALDLVLFYVFWELVLIPLYLMIGIWGGVDRIRAALKFFLYTLFGSMLMLAAILYLGNAYTSLTGGLRSFDYFELQRIAIPPTTQLWLYGAFTLAFAIKVPLWPVHTWLPDAHTEAPTAGSIILAALMLKLGTYGYLRFCFGLFPEAALQCGATLGGVAVVGGVLWGAFCAWKQTDIKRLVAYSSVAHLGYIMLGIFAATPASLEGAILQMINHGISTGLLFLLVGALYDRRHTRLLSDFGGLAKEMPLFASFFVIATLASIGVPGTNGFVGEFLILTGTFVSTNLGSFGSSQAVFAAFGVILAAVYMLGPVQKILFGPITHEENRGLPDLTGRELIAAFPLVVLIFLIGFCPHLFVAPMQGAVARIHEHLDMHRNLHTTFSSMTLLPRVSASP